MAIYDVQGNELIDVYDAQGNELSQAYDINGNDLIGGITPQDWGNMTAQFKGVLDDCMDYCDTYVSNHQNSFAFPLFTDVHTYFSWNEPNYVAYHQPTLFPVFMMLGDMTNTYNTTELSNAVTYMSYAEEQVRLVSIGNHEWGNYDTTGSDPYPKTWYDDLLPASCIFFSDDGLTYYYDDTINNVRYIMLDSNSTVKKQSGVQRYDMDALNWFASVLESSGSKDVIVMNHALGSGFYLVTDTEKANPQSDTTITNIGTFNNIVNAFIAKTTISITVDGVSYSHDFSNNSGDFIGYFTGHAHSTGYNDSSGFMKFTCPALIKNNLNGRGMSFFVIDKNEQKIIWLVAKILNANYAIYEYAYGT